MSDRITIRCNDCNGALSVPLTAAGKKVRCPKCQAVIAIPAASAPPAPAASAPRRGSSSESSGTSTSARRSAAEKPQRPASAEPRKARRAKPKDNNWVEESEDESSYDDNWDSYDSYNDAPAAMPPKKRARSATRESAPRGDAYEAPRSQSNSSSGVNWGKMGTGILMMIGAVVWFVVGLMADRIYFYPPVLFVLGIIAFFKGLFGSE